MLARETAAVLAGHRLAVHLRRDGADLLAQAERMHRGTVGCFQMLDRLPTETGVSIQRVPVKLAEPAQRCHHLLQLGRFEAKEDVLELGATGYGMLMSALGAGALLEVSRSSASISVVI